MKRTVDRAWLLAGLIAVGAAAGCSGAESPSRDAGRPEVSDSGPTGAAISTGATAAGLIAYEWSSPFGGDGIFVMSADGSDVHQVVDPNKLPSKLTIQSAEHPDMSPDGKTIAFTAMEPNSASIWLVPTDGAKAHRLLGCGDGCGLDHPAWSPDGHRIAFVQFHAEAGQSGPPADTSIRVIDVRSRAVVTVVRAHLPRLVRLPSWSHDGSALVYDESHFSGARRTGSVLAITQVRGGHLRRLTEPGMFASFPDWNPTDDRIAFVTYDIGAIAETTHASNLFTISADGSGIRQVTEEEGGGSRIGQPSWTPDNQQVLVTVFGPDLPRLAFVEPDSGSRREISGVDATWGRLQ